MKRIDSEQDMSRTLRDHMTAAGAHVEQVECRTSAPGIPDLDGCYRGSNFKIELKYLSDNKPITKIRSTQKRWFKQRIAAGGMPWCLLYCDSYEGHVIWVLVAGDHISELPSSARVDHFLSFPHVTFNWTNGIRIYELFGIIAPD